MIFRAMEATAATDERRVIKIGDTVWDRLVGRNTGARGMGAVLSGGQAVERMGCVGRTHFIASPAGLPTVLEGDLSGFSGRRIALT